MKYKLPNFLLYLVRLALFVAMICSLCFLTKATSAVIFLVAVAVGVCEFYITTKYMVGKIGSINGIMFGIIDRLITLLPLLFLVFWGSLEWWVLLIIVGFEALIFIYRCMGFDYKKYQKTKTTIYVFYNPSLHISILAFLLNARSVGVYGLFVACVVSAVFVVFSAIVIKDKDELETEVLEEKSTDSIEINSSEQREIVE